MSFSVPCIGGTHYTAASSIPSSLKVMPVGDSLTNGNGDAAAIADGGYRLALGTWMLTAPLGCTMHMIGPNNNGFANGQGAHDGQSGVEIQYHITNLPPLLTSGSYNADLILLMIGTNDINNGRGVSPSLSQLGILLADIRAARASCRVLLSTCLDGQDPTFHTNINLFNAGMPAVVATENAAGGKVTLWDGYSAVGLWNASVFFDALHPLETPGYASYEAGIQPQVQAQLSLF
jgi:lysophospholipase L1-like esterase